MRPSQLTKYLPFAIANKFTTLIKGAPGVGKTSLVEQACRDTKARLIVTHPAVSDPTDYKGLPFPGQDGKAHFLPFGELAEIMEAKEPTVYFLDDLGQSSEAVQKSVMHLILARRVNGHKVSDHVTFIAATNRREDKAGVTGMLEPVKSRNKTIIELEVNVQDWIWWALGNNMPSELVSFARYKPALFDKFEATKDLTNSPSPRTVANVGDLQNAGLPKDLEFEVFKGAAGEGFAAEYTGFLRVYRDLPDIDGIILKPDQAKVPTDAATLYALSGALGVRINDETITPILKYVKRLPPDIGVVTVRDALVRKPEIQHTKAYSQWASENANVIL